VSLSLAILTVTAFAQAFIYYRTLSVALLADLIHNFGDAANEWNLSVRKPCPRRCPISIA
jgi:divalent metal cation (Fe/Co/Zn/Cd) transporter